MYKNFQTQQDEVTATPGPVTATLSFIRPHGPKPTLLSAALTGDEPKELFESEDRFVEIADLRPRAADFTLDAHGFAFRHAPTEASDLYDDEEVESRYYAEVTTLLKREFGAAEVAIFDATRRSDAGGGARNKDGGRGPASRIHVDYTAKSGPKRARDVLGAERFDRLLASGRRIVQVNIWRPIRGPVLRSPLAIADGSTVKEESLVTVEQVFPDRVGEIYHLAYDPGQLWYYAPAMTRDEVLLLKSWDSAEDARVQFAPHAAFQLPDRNEALPPRESIEVRAFVVI